MYLQASFFPITGPLRLSLLSIEWAIILFCLEWVVFFWRRVRIRRDEFRSIQERAYLWLFLGYAINWLFFIISDYYCEIPEVRLIFLNFGYLGLMLGAFFFINIIEKELVFYRKFLFTYIYCGIFIIYFFVLFLAIQFTSFVAFSFWPLFFTFCILYMLKLTSKSHVKKVTRNIPIEFLRFFVGLFVLMIGFGLGTDWVSTTLGMEFRFFGDVLQIIGLALLSLFFISVPSFSEYDWKDNIESLFVLTRTGTCIYEKLFKTIDEKTDKNLISAGLASISILLEHLVDKERSSIIKKEERTIIIYAGNYVYGVIICDKNLKSLKIMIEKLVNLVEILYSNILEEWKGGGLKIFKPIGDFVNSIFS